MQGVRKQESDKFQRFFAIIQEEARKNHAVFYADAGDGNDYVTDDLECEDMMGWLIPQEKVQEFEAIWRAGQVDDAWSDYYMWAEWFLVDGRVCICFEDVIM